MANSARIDELEKKFSENARRYFAPLANEYRKAGDLDRAIEICRAHLPQQPGHMSGHVVYGQALYESRQLEEAKTVFEAALALDPENLIALRHLGDIARDSGDPATARTWYLRVLDADPRNDEVAGMLAELDASQGAAPSEPTPAAAESASVGWGDINPERTPGGTPVTPASRPEPDSEAVAAEGAESATDSTDADAGADDDTSEATTDTSERDAEPSRRAVSGSEPASKAPAARKPAPDAALFAEPPRAPQEESLDRMLNDAFASDADTVEMEAPRDRAGTPPTPRRSVELDEATFAEVDALFDEISPPRPTGASRAVTGAQPTQPPDKRAAPPKGADTGDAMFGDDAKVEEDKTAGASIPGLETAEFISPTRQQPPSAPRRDTGSMAVAGLTSFDQPTEEDSSTRAAFVTETMAELYLQQGFIAEALDIYRQLLAKNPDDASLRDRVDQLERGGGTSLSVAAVSSEVIEAAKQRHATRPVRTVRSFFGRLAGRRAPQAQRGDEGNGDPSAAFTSDETAPPDAADTEPEPAAVRFDLVGGLFGDAPVSEADERAASTLSAAFASGSAEPADAEPNRSMASSTPGGTQGGGRAAHAGGSELSLDQVFREPAARGPRKSGTYSFDQFFSDGTPEAGGSAQPGDASGPPSAEAPEGDLEQFTAWLEGLKRK